jgi:hypothetical protein
MMLYKKAIKIFSPNSFQNIKKMFGNLYSLNHDAIYYHYKKLYQSNDNPPISNINHVLPESPSTITDESKRNKGGWPVGSTNGKELLQILETARVMAASTYHERKQKKMQKLANGELEDIIKESVSKVGLPLENYKLI